MTASRSSLSHAEYDALKNTPEQMLDRGGRLLQTASHQIVRLTPAEREYLEWIVAERAKRSA
jgi:hypothetical protein